MPGVGPTPYSPRSGPTSSMKCPSTSATIAARTPWSVSWPALKTVPPDLVATAQAASTSATPMQSHPSPGYTGFGGGNAGNLQRTSWCDFRSPVVDMYVCS